MMGLDHVEIDLSDSHLDYGLYLKLCVKLIKECCHIAILPVSGIQSNSSYVDMCLKRPENNVLTIYCNLQRNSIVRTYDCE